jgi:hypothetical protein
MFRAPPHLCRRLPSFYSWHADIVILRTGAARENGNGTSGGLMPRRKEGKRDWGLRRVGIIQAVSRLTVGAVGYTVLGG